ncbi:MAG: hypothetical protein IK095_09165 [Oscillospiraceae bacterium]|nr:hypothetical protein [Oscillospiraceae bacterium]
MPNVEDLLELLADMERTFPGDDELTALIAQETEDELDEDLLDGIAAAASRPSYARFLEKALDPSRRKRL